MTLPILPPRGGHHLVELHRQALFTMAVDRKENVARDGLLKADLSHQLTP